ncbi:alkaline phosphatase family protein [Natrialbaceae archaeon A-gly3]
MLRKLQKAIKNPKIAVRYVENKARGLNSWYLNRRYTDLGEPVIAEDWDTLVLLDGCRPEYLFDCTLPAGKRKTRYSAASESWGFMQANFVGRELHDTVYVTANPHAYKLPEGSFYYLKNLLETDWDAELGTVPPEPVTDAAIEAADRFPHKRLIVHYMQPHYPFIGDRGLEVDQSTVTPGEPGKNDHGRSDLWQRLEKRDSRIELDTVREAYKENHELVSAELFDLLNGISGKVVVTADHANLIGERSWPIPVRMYGHPSGTPHPNLRRVPRIEIDSGPRPVIEPEEPIAAPERNADDVRVKEQLEALGYR